MSIEKKSGVGNLQCKVCGQTFQTNINCTWGSCGALVPRKADSLVDLSAPVDVYADWIDACDAVAKEAAAGRATERSTNRTGALPKPVDDDDGFIEHDDVDAEGDYDA